MANGIVQFLIVTCGIFFFAENVTSSPRPIPEADTEVDPAASIDAAEACMCADTWTSDDEAEQFSACNNAKGCPAYPCDDDSERWCITSKLNCKGAEEGGDWMYCDDDTKVSTTDGAGESIADEDNKEVVIDAVSVEEPTTENAEEEQREEEPATLVEVCQSDELTCDNDGLTWDCIDQDLKCDGVNDCEDGLDEKDCPVLESQPETDASQEDTTPPVATITETTEEAVKLGELATCGMVLGGAALECDEGLECKFDDDCFYCTMGTCQKVVADEANAVETVGTATETAVPATMDDETFSDIPPQPEAVTIVS